MPLKIAIPAKTDPESAPADQPTGRQLRMARRIALRHGIKASTDQEAVEALRKRGIDPFERANMLQLVPGKGVEDARNLPALHRDAPPPAQPMLPVSTDDQRAGEIIRIQRDIARRRRRRLALLVTRLLFFVGLPTLLAGIYYFRIATPMYATESQLIIQQASPAEGGISGLGGLFSGTGLAMDEDSTNVQAYLLSRAALQRLDEDLDFQGHFAGEQIDPLQRLEPDGTQEDAYRLYKRKVKIGFDPTEGIIKMEVVAANPKVSLAFTEALIGYAEEWVDQLTARLRRDQMEGAEASYTNADSRMRESQQRIVALQERLGVVSADAEVSNSYAQIGALETELRGERMRLDRLRQNDRPNPTRVAVVEANIARLQREIGALRGELASASTGNANLARATAELQVAQQDLVTRQLMLQQSAQQLETARIQANRQVRYLSTPVPPLAPDEPTYPRAFENTILAFLVFSGIYLMVSLTAAILREQVSG
ncbi:capsule biosynthesis protein [uncultured Jannaschia sp.]|uniref:capsule biosynthesis protein n=1 Tax=uncultured Jannaschia sp. TaxID=293347 RepID=UPI0026035879|nr:capsule biosynthesis protein [uncultured Jannaschia sp.]